MRKPELDTIRQVLEAALRDLMDDAGKGRAVSVITDRSAGPEGQLPQTPIVIILPQELGGHLDESAPPVTAGRRTSEPVTPSSSDDTERKVSHPGLERFTIEADLRPAAPKACFMEPGRTCVNSGACEMRGF